jgi:hypothetical protein
MHNYVLMIENGLYIFIDNYFTDPEPSEIFKAWKNHTLSNHFLLFINHEAL